MLLHLSLLNLWREKHNSELHILTVALFLAVFTVTALMSLTQGISQSLSGAASELLGADLIVESTDPLTPEYQQQASKLGLKTTYVIEFLSMLMVHNQYQLGTITAISNKFPLSGQLEVLTANNVIEHYGPPPIGQLWMQAELAQKLNIKLNDPVGIGKAQFIFSGILQQMPLAISTSSTFAHLVYVNAKDLEKMALLVPGSRAMYRLLLQGSVYQIKAFKDYFKTSTTVTWVSPTEGRSGMKETLLFTKRYSAIILLIQIVLAGTAIGMCTYQYAIRQRRKVALLRTFGASSNTVIQIEIISLLLFAIIVIVLAIFLGFSVAKWLLHYSETLALPRGNLSWQGSAYGGLTGMVLLLGFMLGPLLGLRQATPLSILQGATKKEWHFSLVNLLFSVMMLWLLFALWIGEGDIALKMGTQIGLLSLILLGLSYGLWQGFAILNRGPLVWRFGIAYMVRHKWQSIIQWLVFSIVIALLMVIRIIQQDINSFQAQLPTDTPNYFLLNIQPSQVEDLKKWLATKEISGIHFYPIVRGRMSQINAVNIEKINQTSNEVKGLQRPINLTWMRFLPEDNQIVEGINWDAVKDGQGLISVEKKFSERQGLKIGDTITFQIGEQAIIGKIVQLRTVDWESFKPNFFVIFPPKTLDRFPYAYITSLYLPAVKKDIISDLVKEFVEISVIDIDAILQKIRTMINGLALVLQALLVSVFVMGILIMYISLQSTLKARLRESAMLQILGANRLFVVKVLVIEFAMLGLLSGLSASFMAWIIALGLNKHYFELAFVFDFSWVMLGIMGSTLLIILFGLIGARSLFRISPLRLFKQNG